LNPPFAKHQEISDALDIDFYFAHPYSSWERGLNENTNGLVRQYLKKGSSLININDQQLSIIAEKINSRPRKTLGYKSPKDVFYQTQ
jgi:IS30 family transposase